MKMRRAAHFVAATARKSLGLALALSACAGVAVAAPPPPGTIPEIDPVSISGAVTLFVGGALMLRDRFRG